MSSSNNEPANNICYVKLEDLQSLDKSKLTGDILQKKPLKTNYSVNNNINNPSVASVYKDFNKSVLDIGTHLKVTNTNSNCYLQLDAHTFNEINSKFL
jgi:hypothetical protein